MIQECNNFINNDWVQGTGEAFKVTAPATGEVIGEGAFSTLEDLNKAIISANNGLVNWAPLTLKERTQVMFKFREILLEKVDDISTCVSAESGKLQSEAKAGVLKGVEVLEYAISLQNSQIGGKMEVSKGVHCEYKTEPVGIVAGITPFNFPAMVPMWMIPIALTLGNAFIWKPSEKTPLTATWIAEALKEAGLPSGVFSILHGGADTVHNILAAPEISSVGFVGSSEIAKKVYTTGTSHGKNVLALGGAKNHIILMPDANPDLVGTGISDSFTGCGGQRCMAASVVIAVGDCDEHIAKIIAAAQATKAGQDMGALITKESLNRLTRAIDLAKEQGCTISLDGRNPNINLKMQSGNWLAPTIIDRVHPEMTIAKEELFGPILTIIRVQSLSEALAIENSNPYGNACSVFTQNGFIAEEVSQRAKAGMIGVNVGVPVPREPFSFGGFFHSKFGSGDITGSGSIPLWTRTKKITSKWKSHSKQDWMS